jgi:hypothetical protein
MWWQRDDANISFSLARLGQHDRDGVEMRLEDEDCSYEEMQ